MKTPQGQCPFSYDRNFRAVLFTSPKLKSFADVNRALFQERLGSGQGSVVTSRQFSIEHRYYYTTQDFTINPNDRALVFGKWDGKTKQFRYSLFLVSFTRSVKHFLIVVPLMKMARSLYPLIEQRCLGNNVSFWKASLQRLSNTMREGKTLDASLSIRQIRYRLRGDPKSKGFTISGDDVPNCVALRRIEAALIKEGIKHRPTRLIMRYLDFDAGDRMIVSLDQMGHFGFFVNETTSNFPLLGQVLGYLFDNNLLDETGFPTFKTATDEEMEADDES